MATQLLPSPSESIGTARQEDAPSTSSIAPETPDPTTPTLVLIDHASDVLKSHRRHRMPVFNFAARDSSSESVKRAESTDSGALKSDATHLIEMGLHFFRNSMAYEAVSLYQQALSHAPDSALCHYLLGIALKSLKQEEEARCAWRAAITSPEHGPEAQWARERAELLLSRAA